jgi:hypothetical protein
MQRFLKNFSQKIYKNEKSHAGEAESENENHDITVSSD